MYPSHSSSHVGLGSDSPAPLSPLVVNSTHFPEKVLGRIYTTDFGRYHPDKASQSSKKSLLAHISLAEHHALHDSTRLMGMTFGITLPLNSAAPTAASLKSPTIVTKSHPATLFLSPQVSSSHPQVIPSSAQAFHQSPLVSAPLLKTGGFDFAALGEGAIKTSNWVEVFATPSKSKKRSLAQVEKDESDSGQSAHKAVCLGIASSQSVFSKEEASLAYSEDSLSFSALSQGLSQEQEDGPSFNAHDFLSDHPLFNPLEFLGAAHPPLAAGLSSFSIGASLDLSTSHTKKAKKNSLLKTAEKLFKLQKKASKVTNRSLKSGKTAESVVKNFLEIPGLDFQDFKGFYPRSEHKKMEWCHLAGAALSSATEASPDNLVAMPKHINTWMLCFETLAQAIVKTYAPEGMRVFIKSTVWTPPSAPNLAFALHYQLRCFYSPTGYIEFDRFFNLKDDGSKFCAPRVSDKALTISAFEKFMKYIRRDQAFFFLSKEESAEKLLRSIEKEALKKAQPDAEDSSAQGSTSSWDLQIQEFDDEQALPPSSPSLHFFLQGLAAQENQIAAGQGHSTNSQMEPNWEEQADGDGPDLQENEYDPYAYMTSMCASSLPQKFLEEDYVSDGGLSEIGSHASSHGALLFSTHALAADSHFFQDEPSSKEETVSSMVL